MRSLNEPKKIENNKKKFFFLAHHVANSKMEMSSNIIQNAIYSLQYLQSCQHCHHKSSCQLVTMVMSNYIRMTTEKNDMRKIIRITDEMQFLKKQIISDREVVGIFYFYLNFHVFEA